MKFRKKQKGLVLLEVLLAFALLGISFISIFYFMDKYSSIKRNKAISDYLNTIIYASQSYVQENYLELHGQINPLVNPILTIDMENDLILHGYLPQSFEDNQAPNRGEIRIQLTTENNRLLMYVSLTDPNELLDPYELIGVSSLIKDNKGGVYFAPTASFNLCTNPVLPCIKGAFGIWEDGNIQTIMSDLLLEDSDTEYAIISRIAFDDTGAPFVYRKQFVQNLDANTMNTNLNLTNIDQTTGIQSERSIFFNALVDDTGNFVTDTQGSQLQYIPADTSIGETNSQLILHDAILSSDGGLSSNLIIQINPDGTYPACDFDTTSSADYGKIAFDEDGFLLQCLSSNTWGTSEKEKFVMLGNPSSLTDYQNIGSLSQEVLDNASAFIAVHAETIGYGLNQVQYTSVIVPKDMLINSDGSFTSVAGNYLIIGYFQ